MFKKQTKFILFSILIAASLFFLFEKEFLTGRSSKSFPQNKIRILGNVISLIKDDYVEKPNPTRTTEGAFRGLVNHLDVLSSYLGKESVIKFKQQMQNRLKGTGIVLYKRYGSFPVVLGIKENSPAEKKGVKIGDSISSLDGRSTLMMSMFEANLYLKEIEERPVKLRILRMGKNQEISIERTTLSEEPFSYSPAKGTSGILKFHYLFPPSVNKIKEKILPLLKNAKKPLVLDLRNCYEGDIEEARKLINLFLKSDSIGYFKKRGEIIETLSCPDAAELDKLPLVIWTNQATIGPAEVVAGVLKEYRNAKIIGFQTPGLVAKQNFFALEDGSGLLLTSAVFYINPEKELWQKGIMPDIKVKREDLSLDSYLKITCNLF